MKFRLFLILGVALIFSGSLFGQSEPAPLSTDQILNQAKKTAALENKNVFIIWHASWCGWCHRMDTLMMREDLKDYFNNNYVIEHLVVKEAKNLKHLENPGAEELLAKYNGDKVGIPFWVILDPNGKLLADSFMRKPGVGLDQMGQNTGCPADPPEVEHLIAVLKSTAKIDEAGLKKIGEAFTLKRE